ncbi:PP2C family protein-serine/threonine phosphatase [Nocardioides sp. B-3]|uniref:PP2C family protein-serine/threonine phosphatase n=1 Tax=Nocardioides sp. B-3 TaxID=2895565 RepID=UPI0021536589|nr:protein phosphatase 2C domain-containing protein [Nocardioides sp. B-3]UUZ57811.1 protein phosphatase 2C domain-containing protein [Nocardioides sp. B-3]
MKPVDLHHGAASEVGHVRKVNEDSFSVAPPVFVVADGMGGHSGGDVASRIVVEEFTRLAEEGYDPLRGAEFVAETLSRAQVRILQYGEAQRDTQPRWHAGTTCVAAVLVEDHEGTKWMLVNLGDSRIYRFNDGVLDRVSVDHSVVQGLIDAGEITAAEAATHPEKHVITRAGQPRGRGTRLLPAAALRGRTTPALQRRHQRHDRGPRDRGHPRAHPRPARRRRRAGAGRPRRRGPRQRDGRRRRCGGIGARRFL